MAGVKKNLVKKKSGSENVGIRGLCSLEEVKLQLEGYFAARSRTGENMNGNSLTDLINPEFFFRNASSKLKCVHVQEGTFRILRGSISCYRDCLMHWYVCMYVCIVIMYN
jgi:hypothetical protein